MKVYEESLATKGHKQLDHSSAGLDLVILESLQKATVDSSQAKHTQDKMESPEQWVFAYQHNVFDANNFDKVVGHNQFETIGDNRFEYTAAHYPQSCVAQVLGKHARIVVVDIAPAMAVRPFFVVQYQMFDQDEG